MAESTFIQETIIVFDRLGTLYKGLAELKVDTELKIKAIDDVRYAFFKMKEDEIRTALAKLDEVMGKTKQQAAYYSNAYSILLMHMPKLANAFRETAGEVNQENAGIYNQMQEFKQYIFNLPFD